MFRFILSALVMGTVITLCPPAFSEDASQDTAPERDVYASGWYGGAFLGYGTGTARWRSTTRDTGDFTISGPIAGVYAGRNWQVGQIRYGGEVEFAVSDIEGVTKDDCPGCRTDLTGYLIAKARIGLDLGHGLVFGTLGYGQADLKHILQDYGHTTSSTLTFQVAAGYERPFLERWSVRSEASVMTFGSATASFDGMYKAPILHIWTVKIGLTQHF